MTSSPSEWQWPLTARDVASDMRLALLGVAGASASLETISAEAVRIALWAHCRLARQTSLREAAASTRDILTLARSLMAPLAYEEQLPTEQAGSRAPHAEDALTEGASISRDMLDLLAEQGDVQPLPGGRWIPSPLRLVPVVAAEFSLFVGCQPTHELPPDAQRSLQLFGTFRRITHALVEAKAFHASIHAALPRTPVQPLAQWLGPTPPTREELLEWMRTTELAPLVDAAGAVGSEVEVYAPYVDKPQGLRWLPLRHLTRDGRYLLRLRTPWGGARFAFGEARRGRLIAQSGVLRTEHIRRLRYALDWQEHTPTNAEWSRQRGVLILRSELPARERKLLSALGVLEVTSTQYYPRRWTHLAPASANQIELMLNELGIQTIT